MRLFSLICNRFKLCKNQMYYAKKIKAYGVAIRFKRVVS